MGAGQTVGPRGHSHEQWEARRRFGAGDDTIPVHVLQRRLWWLWAEWAVGASVETGKPVRGCSVTRGDGCLDEAPSEGRAYGIHSKPVLILSSATPGSRPFQYSLIQSFSKH